MKLCLIQSQAVSDRSRNVQRMQELLQAAYAEERPDWFLLPEVWDWVGGTAADKRRAAQSEEQSEALAMVRAFAQRQQVWVHAGSVFELDATTSSTSGNTSGHNSEGDARVFNSSFVFDRSGQRVARYRKLHLFDVVTPDGRQYRESQVFAPGDAVVSYDCEGVRIGCAICYDLRFAELFTRLRREGAELVALPALFTLQTGKDHWETLCRARAIETQTWFCAAGQCGSFQQGSETRSNYGNSLVVNPWGVVVSRVGDREGWTTTRLDRRLMQSIRDDMPVMQHRRADVFGSL